jgi:hypothetical protein
MVTATNNQLTIHISDVEPMQRRDQLIKAIAAAMRWRAHYPEQYLGDADNMVILATLLEDLSQMD